MQQELLSNLTSLGLTKSEAKIYCAMLEAGETTVSYIARATSINRRNVYDALSTLLDKGLIFEIVGEKEGRFAAVAPEKLLEMVETKELALSKAMPEFERLYAQEKVRDRALMYKGVEGFKQYLQDILNTGKDVYCIGAKGGWGYAGLGEFGDWFESEREKKKIKVYNLFDAEMKEHIEKEKPLYSKYGEYRYLPEKFSTQSAVDIFGNNVVTFTGLYAERFDDDVTLYSIVSRDLADAWRAWFRFMWDNASEL